MERRQFSPISVLLQQIVETKINEIIDGLESLVLSLKLTGQPEGIF